MPTRSVPWPRILAEGVVIALMAACSGDDDSVGVGEAEWIGVWELVEADGQPALPGIIWEMGTGDIRRWHEGVDCTWVGTYTQSDGVLTIAGIEQVGAQCGGLFAPGEYILASFVVSGDVLTLAILDATYPGSMAMVFTRR